MSLYSSSNLNLPVFPVLSSIEDNQGSGGYDGRGGSSTPTGGRNKRSGYVVAPEDFNDEYMNIGKKKTSSSNLLSPTHANNSNNASNNNNAHSTSATSLISSSSSSSMPSASVLPEHDFTTEEWNEIITKIDAFRWDEESNPLKISDYLYSLPHEYYQSIHVILYIAKKCSNHFTLLKFAQQFFQYDRRVGSANNSTTPSSIPSAAATNPPPASSNSSHGSTSRSNSLLGGASSGKDTPASSDKGHGPSSAPAHSSTTNNNNNSNNGNNNQILTNMLEKLISHQSEPIKTSLTILSNHSLVNEAINTFKQIQLFMTIVNNANNPPPPPVANSSNASSGVVRRRSTIIFSPPTSGLGSSSSYYDNNHGMNNQSASNNGNNKGVNYYEVALHLLQTMLITSYEELQDEIYLQIIKQIKRNPQIESIELGYQLFLILLSSIPPSRRLLPFLLVFLASNIDVITAPEAKKFAIYSIKHVMMSFLAAGKRKELPTIYELQRLLLGEKMQLHILCIDFSILSEYIDSYTTVKDLEKMMLTKLKILPDHANIFALFEGYSTNSNTVSTPLAHQSRGAGGGGGVDGGDGSLGGLIDLGENHGFVHLLNYNDRIVDILSRWEKIDHIRHDIFHDNKELNATGTTPSPSSNPSKHLQNNNDASGDHPVGGNYYTSQHHHPSATLSSVLIGNHYFIWKVNYYFPLASPERDYHAKRLIYYQGIHDVVTSYYPHSLQDALFLAALQLQVKYGDYVIGKEIKELRSMALLSTILSPLWFSPQSAGSSGTAVNRSEVETRIIALYKKLQHVSSEHATQLFLSYIQTWKLYGTKYFHVKGQQIATASNSNATPTHPPHHPHYYQQQQNNTSSSEKQLILAITLHSVIIIDVMTYHFLADYHYEQIYSCGHTFESFVLIIGTKANQVKSYYRTTQGKEIEEILRIYLTHHKNLQQQQLLQQSSNNGGGNNVTSSPSITAGHTSSSSGNSSSLSLEVSN